MKIFNLILIIQFVNLFSYSQIAFPCNNENIALKKLGGDFYKYGWFKTEYEIYDTTTNQIPDSIVQIAVNYMASKGLVSDSIKKIKLDYIYAIDKLDKSDRCYYCFNYNISPIPNVKYSFIIGLDKNGKIRSKLTSNSNFKNIDSKIFDSIISPCAALQNMIAINPRLKKHSTVIVGLVYSEENKSFIWDCWVWDNNNGKYYRDKYKYFKRDLKKVTYGSVNSFSGEVYNIGTHKESKKTRNPF